MITKDYLPHHPDIVLYQDDEMLRVNTDTEVLGEFLEVYKNDVVTDFGTNNGALMLYASLFHPKKIRGLEINEKAIPIARRNMEENHVENFELIHDNIITYTGEPSDVIICNPPYFKTREDNKSNNDYKNLAKHEGELTLSLLVKSISRNLKDSGILYFLFLTSRLDEVTEEMKKNNLVIKEMQFVYDSNKEYSNVFMVKAVKNGVQGMVVRKPVIIERGKKNEIKK